MWLSILGLLLVIADSSPRFDCTLKTISELVFGRQILSDPPRLNPAQLDFAANAYRIQSRIPLIPDRFGLFSAGSPRLQVWEADTFVKTMLGPIALTTGLLLFMMWTLWLAKNPNIWKVGLVLIIMWGCLAAMVWSLTIQEAEKRRAPGYMWEDWGPEEEGKLQAPFTETG